MSARHGSNFSFIFPGASDEQRRNWWATRLERQLNRIPEDNSEPVEDQFCDWGTIGLLGGQVRVQFGIVTGSERIPGLGANAATLDEMREILTDISVQDVKRTIRTILRYFLE